MQIMAEIEKEIVQLPVVCHPEAREFTSCGSTLFFIYLLVFCRKDLHEAKHEMQSIFRFSDVLLALSQIDPP